jgi:ribose transport system substrate-binding protein
MKPLRWLLYCSLAAFLAVLPACSSKGSGKAKVAFISNNAYEFWKLAERGTQEAAREIGEVEVEFKMPPKGTVDEQRRFMEDLRAKGVKAVAVSPNNVESQIDFYSEVNSRIPVVLVDSDVDETKPPGMDALKARRFYLGTNNEKAGMAVGEEVKKVLPDGGKVMIFVGKLDVQNAVQRRRGVVIALAGGEDRCRDELAQLEKSKYPITFGKYELLDTRTDDAVSRVCREKADDALNKFPDLKCMIGLWEYNPPAMLEALKSFKGGQMLGKMKLVGFDENENTLQGIRDGHVQATVVQSPYKFGYDAVKIMAALVRGDEAGVRSTYKPDAQGRIWVDHKVITKANVDEFEKELKRLKGQ